MKPFEISRVFDAPRERVWRVWTEAEHLRKWWGPKGFKVAHCTVDLRPGGMTHYCLRAPDGSDMWGRMLYREIARPERLVWINSFSDPEGGVSRHPMNAGWPLQMHTTVLFEAQGDKTRVTIQWLPHEASEAESKVFDANRPSMHGGWTGTFSQLEAFLRQ